MADQFDEFMEEVQNDIRQDQLMRIWKKYGKAITAGAVGVVACVGLWTMWNNHQLKKQLVIAQQYILAQDMAAQGKPEEALRQMALISKESHQIYALLAQFSEAALLCNGPTKDLVKAEAAYEDLMKNTKDPLYKDLAALQLAQVRFDALPASASQDQYETILKTVDPLSGTESPWRHFALELKGVLLYKMNKIPESTEVFINLAQDQKTPESMRMRVRLMIQSLTSISGNKPVS